MTSSSSTTFSSSNHTEVHNFLNPYRCSKDSEINILSLQSFHCKAGKWFVPDENRIKLLEQLHNVLTHKSNKQMHFLEMPNREPNPYNMIKIDIDLRFTPTEEEIKTRTNISRRYNDEFIIAIMDCIAEALKEIREKTTTYYR